MIRPLEYNRFSEFIAVSNLHFSGYLKSNGLCLKKLSDDIYTVDFVNAAVWLLSRKCLEVVGGFNPSFFHYGEDGNYKDRIYFLDGKIGIVPGAVAYHYHDYTKGPSIYFTDKVLSGYRSIIADVSDPNKKGMSLKWYVKLWRKLFLSLISFNIKSVKRNFTLLKMLAANKKQILDYLRFYVDSQHCLFDILTWNKTNPLPTYSNKYVNDFSDKMMVSINNAFLITNLINNKVIFLINKN